MKNVLFISDAFLEGGLETRVAEQATYYNKHNISPYLICDLFNGEQHHDYFKKIVSGVNFSPKNGTYLAKDILQSSEAICNFIKDNRIDFIECQPFWCSIPATIAANICQVPISFTLHGTPSGDFIDPIYLEASILYYLCLSSGFDQIFAVSERLSKLYGYLSNNIIVTPNSINPAHEQSGVIKKTGRFAIASRLDALKTPPVIGFLPQLYHIPITKTINIYGDGENFNDLQNYIKDQHFDDKVQLLGWIDNFSQTLTQENYDCVFGIGRVVTDTISSSTPAGILGYGGFAGIINKNNFNDFVKTNFLSWESLPDDYLATELNKLYRNPSNYLFTKKDLSSFSPQKIWEDHLSIEQTLKPNKKPVISQISSILKKHSSADIFSGGDILGELVKLLTHDRLINADLLHSLYEKMSQQNLENSLRIKNIENSLSWKITRPLRKKKIILKKK